MEPQVFCNSGEHYKRWLKVSSSFYLFIFWFLLTFTNQCDNNRKMLKGTKQLNLSFLQPKITIDKEPTVLNPSH